MIALWARVKWALAGLAAAGVAILAAWARGRRQGREAAERARDRARLDAIETAKEIDDEVTGLGNDDLDERYRRWLRPDDPG